MADIVKRQEIISRILINGIHLSVKDAGAGSPMILIHGKGYSKENMNRIFEEYKDRFHVISYDVRGHGESDKPDAFTLEDDAEDLEALVRYFHLDHPVVIGFSMGSYIALAAAEKYPDLFSSLVLIGTKGSGRTSSTQKLEEDGEAGGLTKEQFMEQMVRRVFAPQVTYSEIAEFDEKIRSTHALTEKEQRVIAESLQNFDLFADAHKVQLPVLVMTGEYDGINPLEQGRALAAALPNAVFKVIPDAGHIAFFENPDCVFSQVDQLMNLPGHARMNVL